MPFDRKSRNLAPLALGEERPEPGEANVNSELLEFLSGFLTREYPTGQMRRDVQTGHHGCVRAEFIIDDVPEELRVGLFAKDATYQAWIRFANQEPKPAKKADHDKDFRGMSIKLLGVPGDKILDDERGATTLDFVMINAPVFVTKDTDAFLRLRLATEPRSIPKVAKFFFNPFDNQIRALCNILKGRTRMGSPLEIQYFSTVPIKFGDTAAKYSAKPRVMGRTPFPDPITTRYLRSAMRDTLHHEDVYFDFCVQLQTDPYDQPIEDAGKEWDEAKSPFRRVATIRIPVQQFDSPGQQQFCEDLAYTPWHTVSEHRPLGNVNRARRETYQATSRMRRQRNNAPLTEPAGATAELPDSYTEAE